MANKKADFISTLATIACSYTVKCIHIYLNGRQQNERN